MSSAMRALFAAEIHKGASLFLGSTVPGEYTHPVIRVSLPALFDRFAQYKAQGGYITSAWDDPKSWLIGFSVQDAVGQTTWFAAPVTSFLEGAFKMVSPETLTILGHTVKTLRYASETGTGRKGIFNSNPNDLGD